MYAMFSISCRQSDYLMEYLHEKLIIQFYYVRTGSLLLAFAAAVKKITRVMVLCGYDDCKY